MSNIIKNLRFDVEKKTQCDGALKWFNNNEDARELNLDLYIIDLMKELLTCETSMKYLCDYDEEIKHAYESHYIHNKKYFSLMTRFDSFLLSILIYKYIDIE